MLNKESNPMGGDNPMNSDKLEQAARDSNKAIDRVSEKIKSSASDFSDSVAEKTEATRDQAQSLIQSLKNIIQAHSQAYDINNLKHQVTDTAAELKAAVTDEVAHVYANTKQRAAESVRENPIGTLALVAGVGLLLGYVLGSKHSSK